MVRDFAKVVSERGGGGFGDEEKGTFISVISSAALSPAIVAANTAAEQEFDFAGVAIGDIILWVEKPTHQAGLTIVGGRVDNANKIKIKFGNHTAAGITPTASEVYRAAVLRINK